MFASSWETSPAQSASLWTPATHMEPIGPKNEAAVAIEPMIPMTLAAHTVWSSLQLPMDDLICKPAFESHPAAVVASMLHQAISTLSVVRPLRRLGVPALRSWSAKWQVFAKLFAAWTISAVASIKPAMVDAQPACTLLITPHCAAAPEMKEATAANAPTTPTTSAVQIFRFVTDEGQSYTAELTSIPATARYWADCITLMTQPATSSCRCSFVVGGGVGTTAGFGMALSPVVTTSVYSVLCGKTMSWARTVDGSGNPASDARARARAGARSPLKGKSAVEFASPLCCAMAKT
mmetsp:Transcript_69857/g.194264  ORF Transcript_69857/g.194264 Transcript_69857/m.194264 type:complete len:293 (+) Transcript_69857:267-1145(+)